jgi:hypothetical protein
MPQVNISPMISFRLNSIIEATGANSYHGFLPTLVRNCIQAMTGTKLIEHTVFYVCKNSLL